MRGVFAFAKSNNIYNAGKWKYSTDFVWGDVENFMKFLYGGGSGMWGVEVKVGVDRRL